MLNTVYRLVAPGRFEVEFSDVAPDKDVTIVRPTHLSICHADQRYYQGLRPNAVLKQKLPMALIHEGIGDVVWDGSGQFDPGQKVVMIPNTPFETNPCIAENYLETSKFRSSGYDGYMQDMVDMRPDRVLALPDGINPIVAAFTELVSVSTSAVRRMKEFSHTKLERIGVWGDGNLGYITGLLVKYMFPDVKLFVFGLNRNKLADFSFADEVYSVSDIPDDLWVDQAFECVGSEGSRSAIEQMIDYTRPEGALSLLGVSENPVGINTRMVLEKGLMLFGSSRSGVRDFEETLRLYKENPEFVTELNRIVGNVIEVKNISDMNKAFELDRQSPGKTIMLWNK